METIKIKVYLSIGFPGAEKEDEMDTGYTVEDKANMTDEEWQSICEQTLKDWAFDYIEYSYEEVS